MRARQLILPFFRQLPHRHIEWLALANAGVYHEKKTWFYPFKARLCRQFGVNDGHDLQIIQYKCWCGDGFYRGRYSDLPKEYWEVCQKCNGTKVYDERKVLLIRWRIDDMVFHEPAQWFPRIPYRDTIKGLVQHDPVDPRAAERAMERLLLRYEPETFKQLWLKRWRFWRDDKYMRFRFHVRRVKRLVVPQNSNLDDVPF
jgi:hypothetical protein